VTRLLVIGDCLLDRDISGRVERFCPDAPAPVVDVESVVERPGGAGLAAVLATQTPAVTVTLATGLSDDEDGARLRRLLTGPVRVVRLLSMAQTVSKTRVRSAGQTLCRLDDEGRLFGGPATPISRADEVDESRLESLVLEHDAVLVADYGGEVTRHESVRRVLRRCAELRPVVWDPHPRGAAPVPGTAVATPNRSEAERVVGGDGRPATELARMVREEWPVQAVVVTDGAAGAALAGAADCVHVPAPSCPEGVDPCGAGDRFAAQVAVELGRGRSVRDAVGSAVEAVSRWLGSGGVSDIASAGWVQTAAGSATSRRLDHGSAGPSADEVVTRVRDSGGVVVATGGCFDVLHAGHVQTLERARALGDCLVVLLNSDAGVRRLKGRGRPVHPAADRMRLLEALRCVDAVEVFEDDDPSDALARLQPDIWVKGGDYRAGDLPEQRVVQAYGGSVRILPTLPGRSTTRVLEQLSGLDRQPM
jgi:D-beta-D-heptose 7-phosphate kinase / D-beta-D-heptose 1-phosphate adenosyltransferase